MQRVHAYASWQHYVEHIAPVWAQIPKVLRGDFVIGNKRVLGAAYRLGITEARLKRHNGEKSSLFLDDNPVIVASYNDLKPMRFKTAILMEHGAGQTYVSEHNGIHGGYAGGFGRRNVKLFLCPRESVLRLNLDRYVKATGAAVGCPRLDDLCYARHYAPPKPDGLTVAVSFHWNCDVSPESNSAFPFFREDVQKFVVEAGRAGVRVLGHGHPRAWSVLRGWWQELGVEPVSAWEEVVQRADCYVVDNSSTMFEAAALGIPVVVMESPVWRRDVEHGLRFWEYADVGPTVRPGDSFVDAVQESLTEKWGRRRGEVAEAVYAIQPGLGRESSRAAALAITEMLTEGE